MSLVADISRQLRSEPETEVLRRLSTEVLGAPGNGAIRDLTHFLLETNLVFELILCRSILSRETAADVLRVLTSHDKNLPQTLMKRVLSEGRHGSGDRMIELLATVDAAGVTSNIGTMLVQLLRTCDNRTKSKVALVMGRGRFNITWALQDPDARVRANAVESMWGVDSTAARRILHQGLLDTDHRVRANAIYGLVQLNDRSALDVLRQMSQSTLVKHRASAAWLMGQIGWPEFLPTLQLMQRDQDPKVARVATAAVERLGR
ncbi:MAG: HEAT repeat domain-containing protein [Bryobacterales bacterium]|nr:HEAT repeat domain-containing protein [Bryobacterales bacterium]